MVVSVPLASNYLEAYFYFIYLLIFVLCYLFFSKINSPKINNRGAMTAAVEATKMVSFVKEPGVYAYLESSKNVSERIINKLVNKRTFFILEYLGWFLLLVSFMFSMKYSKGLDPTVDIIMIISIMLIVSPVAIILILRLMAQIAFYRRTKK